MPAVASGTGEEVEGRGEALCELRPWLCGLGFNGGRPSFEEHLRSGCGLTALSTAVEVVVVVVIVVAVAIGTERSAALVVELHRDLFGVELLDVERLADRLPERV